MNDPRHDGSLSVSDMRDRIDAIDRAVASLLAERAAVSHDVQVAKVTSGVSRVDLGREREVIQTYTDALGRHGSEVGHAVLVFCRGSVADAVRDEPEGAQVHGHGVRC